jgi:GNAT superfamily N-acetyltransferase
VIEIRHAVPADAVAVAAVHTASWRSAYAGILPDTYLAGLSVPRLAASYDQMIRADDSLLVAVRTDLAKGEGPRIVGFAAGGPSRGRIAEAEISLLYVLDDWRDQGIGRRLMRGMGIHLASTGARSAFLWVLRDNPNRWFYSRLGGAPAAEGRIRFAGRELTQTAILWDPIEKLLAASPASG